MFCSQCGQKLNDDAKFCARCGARVITFDDTPAPEAAALEPAAAPEPAAVAAPEPAVAATPAPAPVVMDEIPHTEEPINASIPVAAAQGAVPYPAQTYAAPGAAPQKPKKKKKKVWLVILLVLLCLFLAFLLIALILVAAFIKPIRSYVEKVKDSGFVETSFFEGDESETPSEDESENPSEEITPFGGTEDPFGNRESLGPVSDEDISGLTLKGNVAITKVSGAEEMIRYIQEVNGKMLTEEEMNRVRMPDIFSAMDQFEMIIKDYDDVQNGWAITFPVASGSECKPVSLGIRDFIKDGETLNPIRIHLEDNKFSIQRQVADKDEAFAKQIFPEYSSKMSNGTYGIMLSGDFARTEDEDGEEVYSVSGYMQIMLWYDTMSEPYTIMYHYDASTNKEDGDKK